MNPYIKNTEPISSHHNTLPTSPTLSTIATVKSIFLLNLWPQPCHWTEPPKPSTLTTSHHNLQHQISARGKDGREPKPPSTNNYLHRNPTLTAVTFKPPRQSPCSTARAHTLITFTPRRYVVALLLSLSPCSSPSIASSLRFQYFASK